MVECMEENLSSKSKSVLKENMNQMVDRFSSGDALTERSTVDPDAMVVRQVDNPNRSICDFDLIKVIGTGTFGKVYLAVIEDNVVAVKALKKT